MIYAISDIHGEYEQLLEILEKTKFCKSDTLYVLGDVVDRGPNPIKVLQHMMAQPNIIPIAGNHELMALRGLSLLQRKITEESIRKFDERAQERLSHWILNGAMSTIREFHRLGQTERAEILEYLGELPGFAEVEAGGLRYVLVHAGIAGFEPSKNLSEYELTDFLWQRINYKMPYFEDKYTVSGHTPTQGIPENPRPGYIFRFNRHIAIDCGACTASGRLAAICLDSGKEFYSRK